MVCCTHHTSAVPLAASLWGLAKLVFPRLWTGTDRVIGYVFSRPQQVSPNSLILRPGILVRITFNAVQQSLRNPSLRGTSILQNLICSVRNMILSTIIRRLRPFEHEWVRPISGDAAKAVAAATDAAVRPSVYIDAAATLVPATAAQESIPPGLPGTDGLLETNRTSSFIQIDRTYKWRG